jgi:hypothetical protein
MTGLLYFLGICSRLVSSALTSLGFPNSWRRQPRLHCSSLLWRSSPRDYRLSRSRRIGGCGSVAPWLFNHRWSPRSGLYPAHAVLLGCFLA